MRRIELFLTQRLRAQRVFSATHMTFRVLLRSNERERASSSFAQPVSFTSCTTPLLPACSAAALAERTRIRQFVAFGRTELSTCHQRPTISFHRQRTKPYLMALCFTKYAFIHRRDWRKSASNAHAPMCEVWGQRQASLHERGKQPVSGAKYRCGAKMREVQRARAYVLKLATGARVWRYARRRLNRYV